MKSAIGLRPTVFGRAFETRDFPRFFEGEFQHNRHYRTLLVWPDAARIRKFLRRIDCGCETHPPLAKSLSKVVEEIIKVFNSDGQTK